MARKATRMDEVQKHAPRHSSESTVDVSALLEDIRRYDPGKEDTIEPARSATKALFSAVKSESDQEGLGSVSMQLRFECMRIEAITDLARDGRARSARRH